MLIYRISQTKYARSLFPSGIYGRWNSEGQRMIYATSSVALACLENVVHRSGASLSSGDFSIAVIHLDDDLKINEITAAQLIEIKTSWHTVDNYHLTQKIGDQWLARLSSAVLKVPSAIIDSEYNYLLNPLHPEFLKIKIETVNPFKFDSRLKSNLPIL